MTCIVGYIDGNAVLMGCDSAATDSNNNIRIRKQKKVWKINNCVLVGFTGNFSELCYLQHVFKWPKIKRNISIEKWLLKKVHPKIKEEFKDRESSWTLMFGFAKPGRLLILTDCGDLEENMDNFNSIGNSDNCALGCLKTLENSEKYSWEKIEIALEICENYNNCVKRPINIEALVI